MHSFSGVFANLAHRWATATRKQELKDGRRTEFTRGIEAELAAPAVISNVRSVPRIGVSGGLLSERLGVRAGAGTFG